jgi:hypothetical protein
MRFYRPRGRTAPPIRYPTAPLPPETAAGPVSVEGIPGGPVLRNFRNAFAVWDDAGFLVADDGSGGGPGGGVPEAPITGGPWGRMNGGWVEVVTNPIDSGEY